MWSPRKGSPRRPRGRHWAAWAALAVGWLLPSAGCQVEYAGMTLPSGKYMHDDVQYFPPGPAFPWANTQAATQRARMQQMGIETGATGPLVAPVPPGAVPPAQNRLGRPTDTDASPFVDEPQPPPPGAVQPVVPAPGAVPPDNPPDSVPPAEVQGGVPGPPGAEVPPPQPNGAAAPR